MTLLPNLACGFALAFARARSRPWYDAGMADQPSSRRKIVKRSLLALVVLVLLPASYVGWWCLHNWGRSYVIPTAGSRKYSRSDWVFSPLTSYASADHIGSDTLGTLDIWAWSAGKRSWKDCGRIMRAEKAAKGQEPTVGRAMLRSEKTKPTRNPALLRCGYGRTAHTEAPLNSESHRPMDCGARVVDRNVWRGCANRRVAGSKALSASAPIARSPLRPVGHVCK